MAWESGRKQAVLTLRYMTQNEVCEKITELTTKIIVHSKTHSIVPYVIALISENHGIELFEHVGTNYNPTPIGKIPYEILSIDYFSEIFNKSNIDTEKYEIYNRISGVEDVMVYLLIPINKW